MYVARDQNEILQELQRQSGIGKCQVFLGNSFDCR